MLVASPLSNSKIGLGMILVLQFPANFKLCYIELRVLILATTVEPDLTNPTRHRWERPLDTIRGFEAAIYKDEYRGSYVGTYLPPPLHVCPSAQKSTPVKLKFSK